MRWRAKKLEIFSDGYGYGLGPARSGSAYMLSSAGLISTTRPSA